MEGRELILKQILKKYDGMVWTELMWFRVEGRAGVL
jgi:hypothetical protein